MHEHQMKHTRAHTTLAFCHHSTQDLMSCTNTHIEGDKGSVQKLKCWVQFGWFQFSWVQKEAVSFFSVLPLSSNPWLIFLSAFILLIDSLSSVCSLNYSGMCLASDAQFSDFLDGMGPAQFVGRQTLATTSMGERRWTLLFHLSKSVR